MSVFTKKSPRFNLIKNRVKEEMTAQISPIPSSAKRPMTSEVQDIGDIFSNIISQISSNIPQNGSPVDIELKLDSVEITDKGFLVFSRTSKSTSISITIATQIKPPLQN